MRLAGAAVRAAAAAAGGRRPQWASALVARPFVLPCLKPGKGESVAQLVKGLQARLQLAPTFYLDSPVVIDLDDAAHVTGADLEALSKQLRLMRLHPEAAITLQLAPLPGGGASPSASSAGSADARRSARPTKVVVQTVRAGQQVHAEGTNLVIVGAVHPGGEVLADGDITVHGSLRGRALAGLNNNRDACIFATDFDPELIAIGPLYLPLEARPEQAAPGRLVRARLTDTDEMVIEALN